MHNLLVQFLIHLCESFETKLDDDLKARFQHTIRLSNPDEDEFRVASAHTDIEDWRRGTFINLDSALQIILEEKIKTSLVSMGLALACVIARRILVLNIAHKGISYIFARKDPVQYWNVSNMLRDSRIEAYLGNEIDPCAPKYLKESTRAAVQQPRYPFRVINTFTLEIEEDISLYWDCYSILSHTWSHVEVLYADLDDLLKRIKIEKDLLNPNNNKFQGHERKLMGALHSARELGYAYMWLDNCCIDKASFTSKYSDELSESIPSMGDWYQNAQICVVYLEDFTGNSLDELSASKTRWATRGWTLQEIVMSRKAVFYNKAWRRIGDTENLYFRRYLANVCHVPENLLCRGGPPEVAASVVLCYASTRKTFKPEDRVYSVLGMLRVRITADYGEGFSRALERLFTAILQTTGDVTIFNWSGYIMQSPSLRRSLYPANFEAYHHVGLVHKPAYTLCPIRVDYIGVNSRFDIWEIEDITIEEENDCTLAMLKRLAAGSRRAGKKRMDDILGEQITAMVYVTLKGGFMVDTRVLHGMGAMIKILEREIAGGKKTWVLARFSGLNPMADWWICEINDGVGKGETYGKRVAADEIDQVGIREAEDGQRLQQRDMWIT